MAACLFLDIFKAFDTILRNLLSCYGFQDNLNVIIDGYLSSHKSMIVGMFIFTEHMRLEAELSPSFGQMY